MRLSHVGLARPSSRKKTVKFDWCVCFVQVHSPAHINGVCNLEKENPGWEKAAHKEIRGIDVRIVIIVCNPAKFCVCSVNRVVRNAVTDGGVFYAASCWSSSPSRVRPLEALYAETHATDQGILSFHCCGRICKSPDKRAIIAIKRLDAALSVSLHLNGFILGKPIDLDAEGRAVVLGIKFRYEMLISSYAGALASIRKRRRCAARCILLGGNLEDVHHIASTR